MTTEAIEQRVRIAASPQTVWSFWTDAQLLCEWWGCSAEVQPRPGGLFRLETSPGGPVMRGEYIELVPHSRLVFSFGWEHNAPGEPVAPGSTKVEVTLTPVGDETDVHVLHLGLPSEHVQAHAEGWQLFVGRRLVDAAERSANR